MKTHNVTAMFVLALAEVYAQSQPTLKMTPRPPANNRPLSGEEWRLNLVSQLLSLPSPVTNGAAQLYGMGDEAAVDVLKVFSAKPAPTPAELNSALDIIHMAFKQPASILVPGNKQPMATLFLFQHLSITATDPALQERIASETKFVRESVSVPSGTEVKQ
jgi:hypothetical protein